MAEMVDMVEIPVPRKFKFENKKQNKKIFRTENSTISAISTMGQGTANGVRRSWRKRSFGRFRQTHRP